MATYNNSATILVLPPAMRGGLTGIAVFGGLSLFATSSLLIYLAYKAYRASREDVDINAGPHRSTYSIHTQGYFWLVNMFVADLVQSFGLFIVTDSLRKNSVVPGAACYLQGFLINTGDISTSIWSFVIAVHTFFLLAGGRKYRAWAAEKSTSGKARWFIALGIWCFVVFIGIIGPAVIEKIYPQKGPFYNQAGAGWCWIAEDYFWERIFFHYIFLFIDMFGLTILYCILFFYLKTQLKNFRAANTSTDHNTTVSQHELRNWQANLETGIPTDPTSPGAIMTKTTVTVITEDRPSTIYNPGRRARTEADRAHRRMNQVALTLLGYPICYICLTMPIAITRLSQFAGNNWGLTAIYVAACIYSCSGWCNVLLYTATRRGIISWGWLFKKRRGGATEGTVDTGPTARGYNSHYPGSRDAQASTSTIHIPTTIASKQSNMSLSSSPHSPRSIRTHESDFDSTVDYTTQTYNHGYHTSDDDKLVHDRDCIQHEGHRSSNGTITTLVGDCSCRTQPLKSPARI